MSCMSTGPGPSNAQGVDIEHDARRPAGRTFHAEDILTQGVPSKF